MTRATINLEDHVYKRLQSQAETKNVAVEQYLATLLNQIADNSLPSKPGTFGEWLDSVSDITFKTSEPWTRDELYER